MSSERFTFVGKSDDGKVLVEDLPGLASIRWPDGRWEMPDWLTAGDIEAMGFAAVGDPKEAEMLLQEARAAASSMPSLAKAASQAA
jgi:hypothetical protein